MTEEMVNEMLGDYKRCEARAAHLLVELEMMMKIKDEESSKMVESSVNVSPSLSGMPGGGGISDKVGDLAIKFASGYVPKYIKELDSDIDQVKSELFEMQKVVSFVNAWLIGLSEKERYIIEEHQIKKRFWSEMLPEYEEKFGQISEEGMRKCKTRALRKIYELAC